jgi:cleavage and polyadenylation specificity factor subunit 2
VVYSSTLFFLTLLLRRRQSDHIILSTRNLKTFQSLETLYASFPPTQPKLILAYPASLSFGFSRRLFIDQFASVPGNVVLLSGKGEPDSLSRYLWEKWNEGQAPGNKWGEGGIGEEVAADLQLQVKVCFILCFLTC